MQSLAIISIIAIVFVIFAVRYFIKNNIANSLQRKNTLQATLILLWCLPVFLQGLFLLLIGVTHFFTLCSSFFSTFSIFLGTGKSASYKNLSSLWILFTGSILLGFNGWLLKISREKSEGYLCVLKKGLYILYSATMFLVLYQNRFEVLSFGAGISYIFFYSHPAVIAITAIVVVILFTTMYIKNMDKIIWLRYLQLPVKVISLYAGLCFAVAFIVVIFCLLFKSLVLLHPFL